MRPVIGCDPGLLGAFAILTDSGLTLIEMPTKVIAKTRSPRGHDTKKVIDLDELNNLFINVFDINSFIVIEQQQAYPNQGGVSNFTTGLGYGMLLGLSSLFDYKTVHPKTWHKYYGIGGDKKECKKRSIAIVKELFPDALLIKSGCRVESDGLAEAALIANYGRMLIK